MQKKEQKQNMQTIKADKTTTPPAWGCFIGLKMLKHRL